LPGIAIVEDTAQAFGAQWTSGPYAGQYAGTVGALGTFSFFPTKSLGGMGDGGAISSRNPDLLARAKRIASHGQSKKYHHQCIGVNSRLDPLQAAVLAVKLKYFNQSVERKKRIASMYLDALSGVDGLIVPAIVDGHILHQFTIRILSGKRDGLQTSLKEQGIDSMVYYPMGLHLQEAYKHWTPKVSLQVSEQLSNEVLSLPIHEAMEKEEVQRVVDSIKAFLL
jgi:dTDP-4-amino-4,6-dideoxygalactose transaminase